MTIYCAHSQRVFHRQSNYYRCPQCDSNWYTKDPVPMVIIGYSSEEEVRLVNKHVRKYHMTRCPGCHDILTKEHLWCSLKGKIKKVFLWLASLNPRNS